MLGMSNLLRRRLGNEPEPHLHPDADLLTAYVERSLSPVEQSDMVRHLAACSHCREVVALSLPELQPQTAGVALPGRSFNWIPMFRWAAVAATVVVGATLVIERPWKPAVFVPGPATNQAAQGEAKADAKDVKQVPAANAAVEPAPLPQPVQTASRTVPAAPGAAKPALAEVRNERSASKGFADHAFAARQDEARSRLQDAGSVPSRSMLSASGAIAASTVAPPPMLPMIAREADLVSAPAPKTSGSGQPSETGFVVRHIPITPEGIAQSSFAVTFDNEKKEAGAPVASTDTLRSSRVFRFPTKVLAAGKDKLAGAMASRPSGGMALMEKAPAANLHWSISPEGKLIKSSDLTMWHEAYPQKDNLLFTVVVAEGHDVWAGGNHLTLIHSWNGGVDWKKLKLADTANGDITDIQINAGGVLVKTSNNQTFVSQDGGVTWVPLKKDSN